LSYQWVSINSLIALYNELVNLALRMEATKLGKLQQR
jgi:hypothetical protein